MEYYYKKNGNLFWRPQNLMFQNREHCINRQPAFAVECIAAIGHIRTMGGRCVLAEIDVEGGE